MKREIFKDIPLDGYENYRVSNRGRLLNILTGNIIKTHYDKNGYVIVNVLINKELKQMKLHRMVGYAFIPNPYNKPHINHKDGVKDNNYYENIEWCTHQENMAHASKNFLLAHGENHPQAKLTEHAVYLIREALNNNVTQEQIALDFGVGRTAIYNIKHSIKWKHVPKINSHVKK